MEFRAPGVYPANITARGDDGKVDLKRTQEVVRFLFSKGVDGLHVCGTTGEFASLGIVERKAVAEACIEASEGRGTIMIHVGSVSTADCCELAVHATQAGAHAVSSVPPYYYPQSREGVMRHYRRIAEAAGIPMVVYDNPSTTGFTVDVEMIRELASEGLVQGIKLARQDMYSLALLAEIDGLNLYPVETFYVAGMATAPLTGTIGSVGNWIPEAFVGMKRNFEAGNIERAAYLQRLICLLFEAYTFEEIQVTKALVEYRGIPCGITWEPLRPITDDAKKALFRAIDSFDLDFDDLARVK